MWILLDVWLGVSWGIDQSIQRQVRITLGYVHEHFYWVCFVVGVFYLHYHYDQCDPCLGDTWIRCRTCEQRAKELNVGLSKMLQELAVVDIDEETTTVVAFDKTSMAAKAEAERRLENLKLENIQKTVRLMFCCVLCSVLCYVLCILVLLVC